MTRRAALLALAAVVVGLAAAAAAPALHHDRPAVEPVAADRLAEPAGDGSAVWPYTSRSPSVAGRTLALTTVVRGDAPAVRRALAAADRDWNHTRGHGRVQMSPDDPGWRTATGSTRYTYVRSSDGVGHWTTSTLQLQAGSYLGTRLHVRAYESPDGEWTALQPHREHWDWFRLRHTVTGVGVADRAINDELRGSRFVADTHRQHHGLTGGGSTGALTVVELAAALGVVAAARRLDPRRLDRRHLALPAAIAAVVLGVRVAGIAVETTVPALPPKAIAAVLYPVLAAGTPLVAARAARPLRPLAAAALAVAALLGALAVDAALLDLSNLPLPLVLHRLALAAALGALATGAAAADRRLTLVGAAGWLLGLAAPLVGVV